MLIFWVKKRSSQEKSLPPIKRGNIFLKNTLKAQETCFFLGGTFLVGRDSHLVEILGSLDSFESKDLSENFANSKHILS